MQHNAEKIKEEVILEPDNTLIGYFQKERTRLISEMFDSKDEIGIYNTTTFFAKIDDVVRQIISQTKNDTLFSEDAQKAIERAKKETYQKAIEDCIGSVPEKERANFGRETSWEMEHANGFNSCREQTLNNLLKLKSK